MSELEPVRVPCRSGEHPDGDVVSLRPKLGLAGGVAAQQTITDIRTDADINEVQGILAEVYLRHGVAEWTLHDDAGTPIELTPETLRTQILDDFAFALPIANRADALYSPAVVTPLVNAVSKLSRATRAAPSTSASKGSRPSRRKPSKRSSTSTTPTGDTATTSN